MKDVKNTIPFRGAKIPQFEIDVLQDKERLLNKQFEKVKKIKWDTEICFSVC